MGNKKLLLCMALCSCLGLLAGCGKEAESSGEVRIADDGGEASEETVTLTMFAPMDAGSASAVFYQDLIDRYNASNNGVQATFEGVATADGYNEFLEQRLDAGEGDDVFVVSADSVKSLYAKGYLCDLSGLPVYQELNSASKLQSTIGDIAYCIPVGMNAYGLLVNLDILAKYGLEAPENLDEFLNCCRVLKENGETPICLNRWFALTVPVMANGLYQVYGAENQRELLLALNSGEAKIGDTMMDGFELFQLFIREGWYGDDLDGAAVNALKAGDQDYPAFGSGERAFLFATIGSVTRFEQDNPNLNFHAQGVPIPGGTVTLPSIAPRLCVNANSKHLDEALDFVSYLTSGTYSNTAANGNGFLPTYSDPDFVLCSEKLRPAYEAFLEDGQIPIEDMQLSFTYWDTVRELCIQMFDGMTPEEAAAQYNKIQAEQIALHQN